MEHKTELYGIKPKRFHVRSESCAYGEDAPQEVHRILMKACEKGFEPVGIILTPSRAGGGYSVTVFLKILCPKVDGEDKPCPYCITDTSTFNSSPK